jgi:hypothetical protein
MDYNRIVAVTGLPGLYEVISSKTDGAIIRSLDDQTTKFISSRIHNLSHLESIEVYTLRDNASLADLFIAMKNSKQSLPDIKDNKSLKAYFQKVYKEMDFDRVYASDMKKMVNWYKILEENKIDFTAKADDGETTSAEPVKELHEVTTPEETPAPVAEAKPKRTRKKKTEEE